MLLGVALLREFPHALLALGVILRLLALNDITTAVLDSVVDLLPALGERVRCHDTAAALVVVLVLVMVVNTVAAAHGLVGFCGNEIWRVNIQCLMGW